MSGLELPRLSPRRASRPTRILVVGDDASGKTSLIRSALEQGDVVPSEPSYPALPDTFALPGTRCPVLVTEACRASVEEAIRDADAVVLCVDLSLGVPALDRAVTSWLPGLKRHGLPIVVAACKADLGVGSALGLQPGPAQHVVERVVAERARALVVQDPAVVSFVECSATYTDPEQGRAGLVFQIAQHEVLFPTTPLVDAAAGGAMTAGCQRALLYVYRRVAGVGATCMRAERINSMQREVFGTELDAATLRELYDVVGDVQGEAGVARDDAGQEGLTRSGLEYLFALMVQAGDLENAWNLLRAFHLRDDLSLDDEWVERGLEAVVGGAGPGRALELSGDARAFLVAFVEAHARSVPGMMTWAELESAMEPEGGLDGRWGEAASTCMLPDAQCTLGISVDQFLALWDVFMHTDSTRCVVSLIICGFPGEPAAAVRRTQPGVVPHLLRCAVAGAPGSGKHRVMAAVAAQSMRQGTTVPMVKQPRACARVTVGGSDHTVLLETVGSTAGRPFPDAAYDGALVVFDAGRQGRAGFLEALSTSLDATSLGPGPRLLVVGNRSPGPAQGARQAEVAAASHCQKLGLPAPVYVVAEEGDMADLMRVLPEILARGALGRDGERRRGDEPSSRGAGGAPPAAAAKGGPAREAGRPGGLGPAGFATVVCVMALLGAVAWRMRERGWVDARRVWLWW